MLGAYAQTIQVCFNMVDIFNKGILTFNVGEKVFEIFADKIKLKREQTHILKYKGISQISETDIYNTNKKSDIILNIYIS